MDKITVQVEIDLQDLHTYTQTGEETYHDQPVSLSDAVVAAAARQLLAQTREARQQVEREVARAHRAIIEARVSEWIEAKLAAGVQPTNSWGEPSGPSKPLSALIDAEIKAQLKVGSRDRFGGNESVVDRVIKEQVNARLTQELNAAFATAKQAMLDAAQQAGAKALAAAVAKAVG